MMNEVDQKVELQMSQSICYDEGRTLNTRQMNYAEGFL